VLTIALLRFAEAAAAEVKEPSNPVIPDASEVVWAAICFFLLLLLVYTVFMPTLRRLIAERDTKIRGDRDSADRTRDELGVARRDYDAALADARLEANRLMEGARAEVEAHRQRLQAEVDREMAVLRQATQQEIIAFAMTSSTWRSARLRRSCNVRSTGRGLSASSTEP
jgi:F-type H+-transporting ATPase subunit b